jgi:hypothetical protein
MPYITLGTASQLTIKVPTIGSTDWGDTLRTDTFLKIAQHDHTGSGSGSQISTGALAADSVTGPKILLANDSYLRGRNNANSANIDTIKVNTSDKIATGADFANIAMINDTYIQGRNNADSAYISLFKVGTDDKIAVGANILAATIETTTTSEINPRSSVTLTDNTAVAASASVITLSTDESCTIRYRLVRNGVTQEGILKFTDAETVPAEEFTGTDVGVTFSVNSGALEYTTTSTGNNVTMYYTILT